MCERRGRPWRERHLFLAVASAYGTQRVPELRMPVDSPYVGLSRTQSKCKIRVPRLRLSEGAADNPEQPCFPLEPEFAPDTQRRNSLRNKQAASATSFLTPAHFLYEPTSYAENDGLEGKGDKDRATRGSSHQQAEGRQSWDPVYTITT